MPSIARVTMNEGIPAMIVMYAFTRPATAPTPSTIRIPGTTGTPSCTMTTAATTPASAETDVNDRSISPEMRTSVKPAARMPTTDDWRRMLRTLLVVKKYGELNESTTHSSASAMKMLVVWRYLRRSRGTMVRVRTTACSLRAISSISSPCHR